MDLSNGDPLVSSNMVMENPLGMEVLIGKSLISGTFSSAPCLITGGRGELRKRSKERTWGAVLSYFEFPNHLMVMFQIIFSLSRM